MPQEADFYGVLHRSPYSLASVWPPAGNGTGKQRSRASGGGPPALCYGVPFGGCFTGLFRRSFQHGCLSQEEAPVLSCHHQTEEVTVPHCHWQLSTRPVASPVLCHTATNNHFTKLTHLHVPNTLNDMGGQAVTRSEARGLSTWGWRSGGTATHCSIHTQNPGISAATKNHLLFCLRKRPHWL